jgi:hypothetical protein
MGWGEFDTTHPEHIQFGGGLILFYAEQTNETSLLQGFDSRLQANERIKLNVESLTESNANVSQ